MHSGRAFQSSLSLLRLSLLHCRWWALLNVIIDIYIIELVMEAGIFEPKEITIITSYKEQAALIRQALCDVNAQWGIWLTKV